MVPLCHALSYLGCGCIHDLKEVEGRQAQRAASVRRAPSTNRKRRAAGASLITPAPLSNSPSLLFPILRQSLLQIVSRTAGMQRRLLPDESAAKYGMACGGKGGSAD